MELQLLEQSVTARSCRVSTRLRCAGRLSRPTANAKLTIGGIFGYMATNMPADRPGKMKPQEYADIMAFLLYSNGYSTGKAKLTADSAKASSTPLNARTPQ